MIGLFSTSTGSGDSNDLNDRDKLKDYVTTFCTPLFTNADRAIARVRPELFELPSPQQQQPVGPVVAEQPAQQPEITEPAEPAASAIPPMTDENIATLINENMTLRARVEVLEKDLMTASESLNRVLTARTVVTEDDSGGNTVTVLEEAPEPTAPANDTPVTVAVASAPAPAEPEGGMIDVTTPMQDEEPDVTPAPTGRMQVQLASYSSMENAQTGMTLLTEKIPPQHTDIRFTISSSTLSSGKEVFRIVSTPIAMEKAKSICSHFWSLQYGCIIKMTSNS
ncbi:MAG: hypothetical protein ACON4P_00925, partial [Candidatus Puniceispirillales bacterium]